MKKVILFICNGNIHRSVIAAQCLRNTLAAHRLGARLIVDSYGLQGTQGTDIPKHKQLIEYKKEWKAAAPILTEFSIDIRTHKFQKITAHVVKRSGVMIAMDRKVYSGAKNALRRQFPDAVKKIHCFSELTPHHRPIKDPAGSGDKRLHRKVIQTIDATIKKRYRDILAWS